MLRSNGTIWLDKWLSGAGSGGCNSLLRVLEAISTYKIWTKWSPKPSPQPNQIATLIPFSSH
jgi:hypothetical protein